MSVQRPALTATAARAAKSVFLAALLAGASFGTAHAGFRIGWVWADQPSAASYTPDTDYSFNSSGGGVGITRGSAGRYVVTFAGLGSSQVSTVLISAYGSAGICKLEGWHAATADATVRCFDAAGAPADSRFTLLYQSRTGNFGNSGRGLAFLWASQSTTPSYTPPAAYQYNSTGATNIMSRTGVGQYEALLPGLTTLGGTVQITAYGTDAARCKVKKWEPDTDGQHVEVLCFNASGAPSDERFTLLYAKGVPPGYLGATVKGVYGWFNKARGQNYLLNRIYRFNNLTAGALTGDQIEKGKTEVTWTGSASLATSSMLVTAYGVTNSYCNVVGWAPLDTACYGQGGSLKDSQYTVGFDAVLVP
jgi:hypothetical protein